MPPGAPRKAEGALCGGRLVPLYWTGDDIWAADDPDAVGGPFENDDAGFVGSALKNSEGEKASGLLWWEGESAL